MTEKMRKFLEAAQKDAALAEKLSRAETPEAVAALAKELGIVLSEADLKLETVVGELSDDALDDVAGGAAVANASTAGASVLGASTLGASVVGASTLGASVTGASTLGASLLLGAKDAYGVGGGSGHLVKK